MRLSKRGEYGLRAMIDLATWDEASGIIQIKDIAERQNIPSKFLEQILLTLKNAGLLISKMGVGGGYYLAKPPSEITLGHIVRILDGPLAPIRCVSQWAYEPCGCPDERTCGLRLVMLDVRNAIANILDQTSLADVAKRVDLAQSQLESYYDAGEVPGPQG
jgi:Rrf2 family protein